MRSRRRRAGAIAWLMAAGVSLIAPVAGAQSIAGLPASRFIEHRERFTPDGGAPIDLRFLIVREGSGQTAKLVTATHAALTLLSAWFGPLAPALTVAGVPWRGDVSEAPATGLVSAPLRWLAPVRDQSTERALIGALVRQYWGGAAAPASPFERALIIHTGTRAIHELLEGSNFATPRFFGGVVPFPLRSVLLSRPIADPRPRFSGFEEFERLAGAGDEVRQALRALQTLERYVGWPTFLEAISQMRAAASDRHDADAFAKALSDVRGTDLRALVMECLRPNAVFDYSLDGLHSQTGASGLIETIVTINRRGSGRFAIGDDDGGDREATMPLLVRFADGRQVRDYFDGAVPSATLIYSTPAAAVSATVDPDVMLMLDVNRENNAMVRDAPIAPLGVRLALHWMTWLQHAMLSYTALL